MMAHYLTTQKMQGYENELQEREAEKARMKAKRKH